jgi:hypothetical protein
MWKQARTRGVFRDSTIRLQHEVMSAEAGAKVALRVENSLDDCTANLFSQCDSHPPTAACNMTAPMCLTSVKRLGRRESPEAKVKI